MGYIPADLAQAPHFITGFVIALAPFLLALVFWLLWLRLFRHDVDEAGGWCLIYAGAGLALLCACFFIPFNIWLLYANRLTLGWELIRLTVGSGALTFGLVILLIWPWLKSHIKRMSTNLYAWAGIGIYGLGIAASLIYVSFLLIYFGQRIAVLMGTFILTAASLLYGLVLFLIVGSQFIQERE